MEKAKDILDEMREWAYDKSTDAGAVLEASRVGRKLLDWADRMEAAFKAYADVNARQDVDNARLRNAVRALLLPLAGLDLERDTGCSFPIDVDDEDWFVCHNHDNGFAETNDVTPKQQREMLKALNALWLALKEIWAHQNALGLCDEDENGGESVCGR